VEPDASVAAIGMVTDPPEVTVTSLDAISTALLL
jgi:hypothetical protein